MVATKVLAKAGRLIVGGSLLHWEAPGSNPEKLIVEENLASHNKQLPRLILWQAL